MIGGWREEFSAVLRAADDFGATPPGIARWIDVARRSRTADDAAGMIRVV
jgi:hypothetical protein